MELSLFLVFFLTSAVVVISPGPSVLLVTSQGAQGGWQSAIFGILGLIAGTLIYFGLSATGLASVILASQLLFQIIKWIGAVILIVLGLSLIFGKSTAFTQRKEPSQKAKTALFAQGFLVEAGNPKALIYFTSILPQFIDLTTPILPQMVIMGITGVTIQLIVYSIYALIGAQLSRGGIRQRVVSAMSRVAGVALLFAGGKLARDTFAR